MRLAGLPEEPIRRADEWGEPTIVVSGGGPAAGPPPETDRLVAPGPGRTGIERK
jgi:hypothetical protein